MNRLLKSMRKISQLQRIALLWLSIALLVRIIGAVVIHYYSIAKGFGGFYPLASGNDDSFYWDIALKIFRGETADFEFYPYTYVLAYMFKIFGPNILAIKMLNVVAGALCAYVGVFLCDRLLPQSDGRTRRRCLHVAGIFIALYPSAIFYSTQLVKDPLIVFMGLLNLYVGVRLLEKPRVLPAVIWILTFTGVYTFRFYAGLALGLSMFLLTVRYRRTWSVAIVALFSLAIVPYFNGYGWFSWDHISAFATGRKLTSVRELVYSVGGSSIGLQINYHNPIMFVLTYTYSFIIVLFGPFPWNIHSRSVWIAMPETIVIWLFIPIWLKGIVRFFKQKIDGNHLLFLVTIVLVGILAFFADNIGANTRLRMLPWSALLLYVAVNFVFIKKSLLIEAAKGETF